MDEGWDAGCRRFLGGGGWLFVWVWWLSGRYGVVMIALGKIAGFFCRSLDLLLMLWRGLFDDPGWQLEEMLELRLKTASELHDDGLVVCLFVISFPPRVRYPVVLRSPIACRPHSLLSHLIPSPSPGNTAQTSPQSCMPQCDLEDLTQNSGLPQVAVRGQRASAGDGVAGTTLRRHHRRRWRRVPTGRTSPWPPGSPTETKTSAVVRPVSHAGVWQVGISLSCRPTQRACRCCVRPSDGRVDKLSLTTVPLG